MQVIWSRVAQTRSCCCHSCLQAATTVVRRTATATSKRRLNASEMVTACYSTVIATAILVDMKFKDERRKRWDRAIAEVKASIGAMERTDASSTLDPTAHKNELGRSDSQNLLQSQALSILGTNKGMPTQSPPISWNDQNPTAVSTPQDSTYDAKMRKLDSRLRELSTSEVFQAADKEVVLAPSKGSNFASAPTYREMFVVREPESPGHLENIQQMILNLVTRLLTAEEPPLTSSRKAKFPLSVVDPEAQLTAQQAKLLMAGQIWRPKYFFLNDKISEERMALNIAIKTILTKEAINSKEIGSVVAKVCYNLLITSAPPNIDTYNMMIEHFTILRQHHLAQIVVDSFFKDSRFAPTPRTVTLILDHYTAKRDPTGFNSVVQRMRGTVGSFRIKKRRLSSLSPEDSMVRGWAQKQYVVHRNGCLTAKVPRNASIFHSLILGSLLLFGVKRAALYFVAALREGFHVSGELFEHLAKVCLSEREKKVAVSIIFAIVSRWCVYKGPKRLEHDAGARRLVLQLLDLCGLEPSLNANHQLPGKLRSVDPKLFNAWSRALKLELLDEHITQSSGRISGLEILLATALSKSLTIEETAPMMLELIDFHFDDKLKREPGPGPLVTALQFVIDGFGRSFKDKEAQLLVIIYDGLSPESQEHFTAMGGLSSNLDVTSRLAMIQKVRRSKIEVERQRCLQKNSFPKESGITVPSQTRLTKQRPQFLEVEIFAQGWRNDWRLSGEYNRVV